MKLQGVAGLLSKLSVKTNVAAPNAAANSKDQKPKEVKHRAVGARGIYMG